MHLLVLLLCTAVAGLAHHPKSQAHLPLHPGLPAVDNDNAYASFKGFSFPSYLANGLADPAMGGDPDFSISAALRDPYQAVPQPFHTWSVNHASGPSVFDCPDGFTLHGNTCLFVRTRPPEYSCPYGTYQDPVTTGCIQVDSVTPDRTCPSGFSYFMRGCIRRTQVAPQLTCPAGFVQLEETCYSATSIHPQVSCPYGYTLRQMTNDAGSISHTCYKEHFTPPQYTCPIEATLAKHGTVGGLHGKVSVNEFPPNQEDDASEAVVVSSEPPVCVESTMLEPKASCPENFRLLSGGDYEAVIRGSDAREVELHYEKSLNYTIPDVDDLLCVLEAEYYGVVRCPDRFKLHKLPFASTTDSYRGVRCIPAHTFMLGYENDQSQDFFIEHVVNSTFPPSEERKLKVYKQAATKGRSGRRTPRMLLSMNNSLFEADGLSNAELLTGEGGTRTGSAWRYPEIVFSRESCNVHPIRQLSWKSQTEGAVPIPICREIQVLQPYQFCPAEASVKCTSLDQSQPPPEETEATPKTAAAEQDNSATHYLIRKARELPFFGMGMGGNEAQTPLNGQYMHVYSEATRKYLQKDSRRDRKNAQKRQLHGDGEYALSLNTVAINSCIANGMKPVCTLSQTLHPATATCSSNAYLAERTLNQLKGNLGDLELEIMGDLPRHDDEDESDDYIEDDNQGYEALVDVCIEEERVAPIMQCPFGVGRVAEDDKTCQVLISQPTEVRCPEGFTQGSLELKTGAKRKDLPELGISTAASVCELVEYADYQITCPLGYKRDKARNTPSACLAEKILPPALICPPGYIAATNNLALGDPGACQKSIEVAPTVISYPNQMTPPQIDGHLEGAMATACVLTKENKLSCGLERKYLGATDMEQQLQFGQQFKHKMDTKGSKHTGKYTST